MEEATSFGLHEILNIIGILASGIVGILAGRRNMSSTPSEQTEKKDKDKDAA